MEACSEEIDSVANSHYFPVNLVIFAIFLNVLAAEIILINLNQSFHENKCLDFSNMK